MLSSLMVHKTNAKHPANAMGRSGTNFVDLGLPKDKKPSPKNVLESTFGLPRKALFHNHAVGSTDGISEAAAPVYHNQDLGLFETILEVWKNHWVLRTRPEDWWFPVVCRIAKAIDKVAQREDQEHGRTSKPVRNLFVNHEGKQLISFEAPVYNIYEVDYEDFFQSMAEQIEQRIKVPNFAKAMQNDFSSSQLEHRIASQINLMASVKQFFAFRLEMYGCGISGLELLGEQHDWDRLSTKLQQVREILKPIQYELGLYDNWFNHVDSVFQNLSKTFALSNDGKNRAQVEQFWSDILCDGKGVKFYGPSGMSRKEVEQYDGWLILFLTGQSSIEKEEITPKKLGCLNSLPVELSLTYLDPVIKDTAMLTSGIMGFTLHDSEAGVPCLAPHHMWAMQLPMSSPLRRRHTSG